MASEFIFDASSAMALIFSCVFMVPDTLGLIIVLMALGEGLKKVEQEYGADLNATAFAKNVKYYSFAAVTVLMSTIFSIFGAQAFSVLVLLGSAAGVVLILMLIYKMIRVLPSYDNWKASGMVSAQWSVTEEGQNGGGVQSSGVFMEMPQDQPSSENSEQTAENEGEAAEQEGSTVKTIYLAGGCFWGAEKYLSLIPGVVDTNVGYANGNTEHPSYEDVKYHHTGHAETVRVKYDETKISLEKLLEKYFEVIDPVSLNKQGEDEGVQYRTGIYYTDRADLTAINKVYEKIAEEHEEPLAVEVLPLTQYFEAEEYHQKYLDKNPAGYCHIDGCMFERAKEL